MNDGTHAVWFITLYKQMLGVLRVLYPVDGLYKFMNLSEVTTETFGDVQLKNMGKLQSNSGLNYYC